MLKLLSNLKTELTATIKDIEVRELNLNSLEESLNSIFKNIKPSVTIIPGTGSGGEEGEGDSSGDNDNSGSLEGEGAHNITGGTINGIPIPDDFFDSENITEEDIAKQEPKEDEIKIDNIKTENGNLFTEEEIIEIEQAIKEEVKQAVEQAKQENKTEEEIEQIKQTIIEEKTSEYTTQSFKEDFKEQLLSQYKKENSLILFVNNKTDKLSETMKEISQKIEAINSGEITAEDIEKETKEKAQKILDSLGIDENTTDDEYREIAEKKANELVDAINGKKTDDEVVNAILDNMNEGNSDNNGGFNFGLRRDIYERIKAISDFGKDIDCYLYSIGVAEVTARYFTTGVMHIAVHIGGLCIVGVGTSLVLSAIQNLINGMQLIQSGTKSTNPIDQAQKLADGISAMYSNGTITSLVIGTMTTASSPIPFVGNGMQTSIQHSSMKIIIMISALAAYIMLMAGGLASMAAGTQKAWNQMLSAIGAKDGNDLFAMLMAAGIKASLITTIAKTYETTAQSTGTGLLIPFGP